MNTTQIVQLFLPLGLGMVIGSCLVWLFYRIKMGDFKNVAKAIVLKAKDEAEGIQRKAELEMKICAVEQQKDFENAWQEERKKIRQEETRLKEREDKLEAHYAAVERKSSNLENKENQLSAAKELLQKREVELQEHKQQSFRELERVSALSLQEAKDLILQKVKEEMQVEMAHLIYRMKQQTEKHAETHAAKILATTLSRLAVRCVSENTICTVSLPSEEMKGRIIGREGRNIRCLEQETGASIIIDDTPCAVIISGFDPVRKYIAKTALEELVLDGRIHPTRIEEVVLKVTQDITKQSLVFAEEASLRVGAYNIHPEILQLLGRLKFRYSLGQNVLEHSIEVSHIMGLLAAELKLDVALAKRIGLLHDIGKAISHEVEGTHAIIGHDIALKYGESAEVANGIGCHHEEIPATTIEGSLCGTADAISASRPGARIEAVDHYIKRLKELETLSLDFPGVLQAFALQAGREVRVVVHPELVDDAGLLLLSRELAKKIERNLTYPGKIKVTAIREKRIVEYAV